MLAGFAFEGFGMLGNFDRCYRLSRISEGGYVNHPDDNGGATNKGVTQERYNTYRRSKGQPINDVRWITDEEAREIYTEYWHEVKGDELPLGMDYAVFDFSLHSGSHRAVMILQTMIGAMRDGILGPVTLQRLRDRMSQGAEQCIKGYCERRLNYVRTLPDWPVFGRGWASRITDLSDVALGMLSNGG
jgi:lysozyme family protein